MSDIFREVDEELRQEKLQNLWKRYGGLVMVVAVLVVVVVGGYQAWQQWRLSERREAGEAFATALDQAGRGERQTAIDALSAMVKDAPGGYRTLARLQEAGLLAEGGDVQGALALYDQVANDTSALQSYRDLARISYVLVGLETVDAAALEQRLAPLLSSEGAWRPLAREAAALLALKLGDTDKARELYTAVADDLTAPPGVRTRAAEMLAALGGRKG